MTKKQSRREKRAEKVIDDTRVFRERYKLCPSVDYNSGATFIHLQSLSEVVFTGFWVLWLCWSLKVCALALQDSNLMAPKIQSL